MVKNELVTVEELKSMHINYDHKSGLYRPDNLHLTLFRVNGISEN